MNLIEDPILCAYSFTKILQGILPLLTYQPLYYYCINSQLPHIKMLVIMKGFAGFGGFFILVIGLAMLGVTIYGFLNSQLLFNQYTLLIIILASDVVIILASVAGIVGVKYGKRKLMAIFQLIVMIFCVVFTGLGVGVSLMPQTVFAGNCSDSSN